MSIRGKHYLNIIKKEKKEDKICVCFGGKILGCFDNTEDGLSKMDEFTSTTCQHFNISVYYPTTESSKG